MLVLKPPLPLANWAKKIFIFEYNPEVKADKENQEMVEKSGKVEIMTNIVLKEIKGTKFVDSIIYQNRETKRNFALPIEGVFVEIGYAAGYCFCQRSGRF